MEMKDFDSYKVELAPDTIHYVPEFISAAEERQLLDRVYAAPKPRWTQLAHRRLQNWGGLPHPKGMLPETIPEWLRVPMERIGELGCFGERRPNHVLVNEYRPGQGIMPHTDGPLFTPVITTVTLGSHALLDLYTPRTADQGDCENGEEGGRETASAQDSGPVPAASARDSAAISAASARDSAAVPAASAQDSGPVPAASARDSAPERLGSLLLEPRSLLVVRDAAYHHLLHGIEPVTEDVVTESVFNRGRRQLGERLQRGTRVSLTIRHVPKVLRVRLKL